MDVTSDRPPTHMKSTSLVPLNQKEVAFSCLLGQPLGVAFSLIGLRGLLDVIISNKD